MTVVNMNRDYSRLVQPLSEPSAELQRLRTFNKLALDTLRELYDLQHPGSYLYGDREEWEQCMKRCKKVLA